MATASPPKPAPITTTRGRSVATRVYYRCMARFGRQSWQVGNVRLPAVIGALIAATLVTSLAGVIGQRNGLPLIELGVLSPERVWQGQLWRLTTWVFFELHPYSLVFACLMLYWFGRG